jgi:hypothetical protein
MMRAIGRRFAALAVTVLAAACVGPAQPTATPIPRTAGPTAIGASTTGPTSTAGVPSAPPGNSGPFSIPGSVWLFAIPPLPPGSDLPFADGAVDYLDLWKPDAQWADAASKLSVFEINGNPADISIAKDVSPRGMKLAFAIGAFSAGDLGCGFGVEGYDFGLEPLWSVRDAGGHIDLLVLDEPYAFGVRDQSPGACHFTLEEAAQQASRFTAMVRDYDPTILIGEDEPLWADISADDIGNWLDAYAAASGHPMAFLHLDPDWTLPDWPTRLRAAEDAARQRGVPVAPTYNGSDATSDAEWTDRAMERAYTYEEVSGGKPDHVTFESWFEHPDYLLPDSDPTTFTGLINRYFAPRTTIELTGAEPAGPGKLDVGLQLATVDGSPIESATVKASLTPLDAVWQVLSMDGVVPDGATGALGGIRVNYEGVGPGNADIRVYGLNFSEGGAADNLIPNSRFNKGLTGWGVDGTGTVTTPNSDEDDGTMLRLRATPDQWIAINGPGFPVSPASSYHFEIAVKVPPSSVGSAYATVMFLTGETELQRDKLPLAPQPIDAGSDETDGLGRALFHLAAASGTYTMHVDYGGDGAHWPAWLEQEVTIQ